MATIEKQAPIADLADVETRQDARGGWELQCPECKQWRRELLTTGAGVMCWECWKLRKDEGTPGAG